MADFYLDHGAYASALGATPTWGTPQEGDGNALAPSSTASIGSVLFGAVPTSGTISVCGVSISTSGVLSAGSVDAAANALATNINATTTTVGSNVATGTPQLRNLVYARGPSSGAAAGTCEIMMRVGSTTLNHAANANVAIASTLNNSPTLTQFIGGVSGCWGYLINGSAIGVSGSIAAMSYGLLSHRPMVWTAQPAVQDITWVRSGTNPTITYSASTFNLQRSQTWPLHMVIDTNTKWTSDGAAGTVTVRCTATTTGENSMWGPTYGTGYADISAYDSSIKALRYGGLVFAMICTAGAGYAQLGGAGNMTFASALLQNVWHVDESTGSNVTTLELWYAGTGGGTFETGTTHYENCLFRRVNPIAVRLPLRFIVRSNSYFQRVVNFRGCTIEANVSGATCDPLFDLSGATGGGPNGPLHSYVFDGGKITGWTTGNNKFALTNAAPGFLNNMRIIARDVSGLAFGASYGGMAMASGINSPDPSSVIQIHSPQTGGPFRYENRVGIVEFNPDASPAQPTLAATQPDGTPWSLRAVWLSTSGVVKRTFGFQVPALRVAYVDSAATRTLKVEFFYRTALQSALAAGDLVVTFAYVSNVTGELVIETRLLPPVSSSASWAGAGSWSGYAAYKVEHTTAVAVKQGTEVTARVSFFGVPRTSATESVFIDPELGIT